MPHWHLVGTLGDIPQDQPVSRTIGTTPVVLFRTGETVTALRDRCAHRFAPLSLGKVVDGTLQCPYHGLRYGRDGRCVFNPHGDGAIPELAQVATYLVEQHNEQVFVSVD